MHNKNYMLLFVEIENMHQLELMIMIQYKDHLNMSLKIQKIFNLFH
jgi:hypothetical protein